jgi:hypothetical protein
MEDTAWSSLTTSEARKKFNDGLKPDLAEGWLIKHSQDPQATWRLLGPNEKLVGGLPVAAQRGSFGDDKFVGIDLLVELKKENQDVDN